MERTFPQIMSELRKAKGISQRKAAADLNISQALISHYENGAREPGLGFVRRACRYYGVSADYLLGLTEEKIAVQDAGELAVLLEDLRVLSGRIQELLAKTQQKGAEQ